MGHVQLIHITHKNLVSNRFRLNIMNLLWVWCCWKNQPQEPSNFDIFYHKITVRHPMAQTIFARFRKNGLNFSSKSRMTMTHFQLVYISNSWYLAGYSVHDEGKSFDDSIVTSSPAPLNYIMPLYCVANWNFNEERKTKTLRRKTM